MRMELGLRQRLEQRLVLAPQIIQSIEILQLPLQQLLERIEQEQIENPALEAAQDTEEPTSRDDDRPAAEGRAAADDGFASIGRMEEDFHDYFWQASRRGGPPPEDADRKQEALQNSPGRGETLGEHLRTQLHMMDLPARRAEVAEAIANNLDRHGRLTVTLEEIAGSLDTSVDPEEAEAALHVVQSLEPPGVGARDLTECLLLQLDRKDPDFPLLERLIRDHLADIEHNRLPMVAREIGVDLPTLKALIAAIASLDPMPGTLYDTETVPNVTPDVIVEMIDGRYEVRLNDNSLPGIRVSLMYERMARSVPKGSEAHAFLRKKIESARWLVDAVQQRKDTLLKISREIVRVQEDFLERGVAGLKPLKMQEVADADTVQVHVSTVSRAISQKHITTPWGMFPIKYFFSGGLSTGDGDDETSNAVKARIQTVVDGEDKRKPLSDENIASKLKVSGLEIARRTVAKYRKQLRIPSSRRRKEY